MPDTARAVGVAGFLTDISRCGIPAPNAASITALPMPATVPAVFVILLVGFLVVGLALWLEVSYGPPLWLHLLLWIPLTLAICLWLLRALKGLLINLQYKHDAHEGELDND